MQKGKTVRGIFRSNKLFAPPLDPFRVSFRVRPCLADLWFLALLGFASCQNRWRARFRSSRDRQFLVSAETPAPGPRPSPLGRRAGHNRRLGLRRQNGPSVTTVAEEVYSPISLLCWYVQRTRLTQAALSLCCATGIRCDGQFPCQHCINANLTCKRDHIPRKRGPKRGHGRVINELRAQEAQGVERGSRESSSDLADYGGMSTDGGEMSAPQTAPNSVPSSPPDTSGRNDGRKSHESRGSIYTTDQYRPTSRSYLYLIPQCVELYYEHIYPIMPLVYMPAIRAMVSRTMNYSERNVVYALCALTCLHMRGKNIQATAAGPDSWEAAGRFFLDECISVRQSYDFLEDQSLYAVISSFWVSTSFFEIHQDRKSWFYLKEALHLALELGLDDDSTYVGLSPEEKLCRQRVFWILFVTER